MFIRLENAPLVLIEFIETYLLPQSVGLNKFAMGMAIGVISLNGAKYAKDPAMLEKLDKLGVLHPTNGLLNVERAKELLKYGTKYSPKTNVYGIVFDEGDVESIYEIAKQYKETGVNEDV